jgi:protein required for attachment to host cells
MRVRIVVADRGEARFYDAQHANSHLHLVGELTDPLAHQRDRDFKSDRPGRVFDHAAGPGRRGAVGHHATGGENSPLRHEAEAFAHRIINSLEQAQQTDSFDKLVLVAEPRFLGELRDAMPKSLANKIVFQVDKDLVHQDDQAISKHLPADVFFNP